MLRNSLFIVLALFLVGFSCKTQKPVVEPVSKIVEIHGDILIYGTDNFNYVGITNPDGQHYKVVGPLENILREKFQVQIVKIKGYVVDDYKNSFNVPEFYATEFVQ